MKWTPANVVPSDAFLISGGCLNIDSVTSVITIAATDNTQTGTITFDLVAALGATSYGTMSVTVDVVPMIQYVPPFIPLTGTDVVLDPTNSSSSSSKSGSKNKPGIGLGGKGGTSYDSAIFSNAVIDENNFSAPCRIESIKIEAGQDFTQTLPTCVYTYADTLQAMVVVDVSSATTFAKFSSTFGQVFYKPRDKNIGYYTLSCSFRDNSDYEKVGPTMKFKV